LRHLRDAVTVPPKLPSEEIPRRDRPIDALGVAVSLFCCLLWAGNSVAIKFTVPEIPAFGCAALRFTVALPIIGALCRAAGDGVRVGRRYWSLLLVGGLFNFAQIGSFTLGTSWTNAGRATTLINIHPLVVAPLGVLLLGERLSWRALVGSLLAVSGVVAMLTESLDLERGLMAGDLLVLSSGVLLGVYIVYQKFCLRFVRPLPYLFWNLAISVPFFAASTLLFEGPNAYRPTPVAWLGLAYQALVVSGAGFSLWMWLLRRYPVTVLSVFGLTTPVMGILLGYLMRGEPMTRGLVVGCALLVTGLYLVVRR